MRERFIELYTERVCVNSSIFSGLENIHNVAYNEGMRWGIVTNKPQLMTLPLLEHLGLAGLPGSIVSGDQLPQRKPHPAPLLLAAEELGVAPAHCVYVGDAPRDIQAGHAAGMMTIAAGYGYIRPHEHVAAWGADRVVRCPAELTDWLTGGHG
ncbi:MAG TPA: HAD-IA family hydrolase [Gammaproteobacteria bacterium]|nr:HAD-IA family hydrolase [Gammaproteobacteria bacterium]